MESHVQLTLRVKPGSEMDKMARALLEQDRTDGQMRELAGSVWGADVFRRFCSSFDNMRLVRDRRTHNNKLVYVDPNPVVPVSIGMDVNPTSQVAQAQSTEAPTTYEIRWPQAPPLIDSMGEVFRKPGYFDTMLSMVEHGRHIALAGPPGVGKDTAVQELAAQLGRPLVTVGGDAGFRRRDLVGSVQISNGRSYMDVAEYAAAVVNGWWVLMSEVNAADADALMFINTQLAPPYAINIAGKSYPVHKDFRLFVTYNPGLVGTKPLPQSFKDRFFSIQVPFYTSQQLRSMLVAHGMPQEAPWASEIVTFGLALWDASQRGQLRYQVTARRLQDAVVLLTSGLASTTAEALKLAVIASIDSPVEAKVAEQVLRNVVNN